MRQGLTVAYFSHCLEEPYDQRSYHDAFISQPDRHHPARPAHGDHRQRIAPRDVRRCLPPAAGRFRPRRQDAIDQVTRARRCSTSTPACPAPTRPPCSPRSCRLSWKSPTCPVIDTADRGVGGGARPLPGQGADQLGQRRRAFPEQRAAARPEHGAAVIALCMDDDGIPIRPGAAEVAGKIVERAARHGIRWRTSLSIPGPDDGRRQTPGALPWTPSRMIVREFGSNVTMGAATSPRHARPQVHQRHLHRHGIHAGLTCPITNPLERSCARPFSPPTCHGRDSTA